MQIINRNTNPSKQLLIRCGNNFHTSHMQQPRPCSASAPTVAGMLSLINDERLNAGQPTLGFINTRFPSQGRREVTRAGAGGPRWKVRAGLG